MNQAIKQFIDSIVSIATGALSGNIPLIGAAAVVLLEQMIGHAQSLVDGDQDLTEEEKAKLKAVLANISLKSTDDYLQEAGTSRGDIEAFIEQIKNS